MEFVLTWILGTTFRYRPDAVLINTPTGYRTIFGPKGNVRKSDYYRVWPKSSGVSNTWNATDVHTHAPKRRVLNHAFSEKALRSAEPFVQSNTDRWCELIADRIPSGDGEQPWSTSLNMAHEINHLVFDILGDLCFGKSFEMKEPKSDKRYIPELLANFLVLMHPIAFSPMADWWIWLKPRGLDKLISLAAPAALVGWETFVAKCLQDRTMVEEEVRASKKPESEVRKDFFYYLFDAKDPETGAGYTMEELYSESELLIIAGSDTTSIVMSAMVFYLARNPAIQARLAAEISSTFSGINEIQSGSKLQDCKYLKAFIQEASRMTPPIAAEPARQVRPGGTVVDGNFFPEGTKLSTGLYCLSYNEEVYPEPFKFRPERWIVGEGATPESLALAEAGFCAFSTGSRGCVGKNLAWLEMMIVMAKLVWNFELKQDETNSLGAGDANGPFGRREVEQYQIKDAFVAMRDGPMVQFRKRLHS